MVMQRMEQLMVDIYCHMLNKLSTSTISQLNYLNWQYSRAYDSNSCTCCDWILETCTKFDDRNDKN